MKLAREVTGLATPASMPATMLVALLVASAGGLVGGALAGGCATMTSARSGTGSGNKSGNSSGSKAGASVGAAAVPARGAAVDAGRGENPDGGAAPREIARAPLGPLSASKWELGNGLTAVLMSDPTATSVSYTTWFRVGSRDENEPAGETGLAHLFEHLMFTQTKGQPAGAFDRSIEAVGGNANAMTYYDFTAYIDNVPPDQLGLMARLEADRMVNLALEKRQVANERDVVAEERLSSVEDSVDGSLDELMYKQAFRTHPYRWPVIGWMKDIKAMTERKASAFYRRFYTPDNAVVVIAGRFDEAAALDALARSYGALPRSSAPARPIAPPELAPAAEVRATLVRPVPADRLVVGYPAPGLADPDRAIYELIDELLLGGPSSRLYKKLVIEHELASSARGDVAPTRDPGLYAIWVQLTRGHTAVEAEELILQEIAGLARTPIPERELEKAKVRLETAFWRDLGSSHGKAELLGQFEIACGDFRRLFQRAGDYARVTPADIQRVVARYLSGPRSVVVASPPETLPAKVKATPGKKDR
jgi:zinc protease